MATISKFISGEPGLTWRSCQKTWWHKKCDICLLCAT